MTTIRRERQVPHDPAKMYELVNRIEDYPEFLPWCHDSHIISRDEDEVRATLDLAHGPLHKSFSTCNRLQKNKMIEVRLLEGPFKHLEGFWRFETIENNGCNIEFDLEFELAGHFLDFAFGPVFQQVSNTLVDLFCERADTLYGK